MKVNTEKPETGGGPGSHGGRERGAAAGAAAIALIVSFITEKKRPLYTMVGGLQILRKIGLDLPKTSKIKLFSLLNFPERDK